MSRALDQLGRAVADHQDDAGRELDVDRGLNRFRTEVDRRRLNRRSPWAFVAAAVALVVGWVGLAWPARPLEVSLVQGADAERWIEGADEARFSDGSVVVAEAKSRWRVAERTARGATVQLERGALTARVVHREDTSWQVDAGPFAIRVTGTAFTTSWDPARQVFGLTMHEGTVVLSGPGVGGQLVVTAPEHVQIQLDRVATTAPRPTTIQRDAPAPPAAPSATSRAMPSAAPRPAPSAPPVDAWREHARGRRYAEALAELRALGAAALTSASPADLLLIAQTARLGGDGALAQQALVALREHHPASVEARTAQFLEGRMHFDQGRHAAAVTALSGYLQAAPDGAFAGEAQLLLILALHHAGRSEEARSRARLYLQHHPTGPQADRLRSILEP